MKKKVISVLLVSAMVASMAAGCGNNANNVSSTESGSTSTDNGAVSTSTYDTLVIGTQSLDGVFSPFFYTSAYDSQVAIDPVFASVCTLNPNGELVDNAGHCEIEEVTAEDGSTKYVYTISIQEGMVFSDGEPVTIDDLIFSYYVYADPTYDGMSTFATLDIEGLDAYKNSAAPLWKVLMNAGSDNTDFTNWDEDTQKIAIGYMPEHLPTVKNST